MSGFRVGRQLATTIYLDDEEQPCAWVPGDPALAARIVALLNEAAERAQRDLDRAQLRLP